MYIPYCLVEKCKEDLPTELDKKRFGELAELHADTINLVARRLSDLRTDGEKNRLMITESELFDSVDAKNKEDELFDVTAEPAESEVEFYDGELHLHKLYDFLDVRKAISEQAYTLKDDAKAWFEKLSQPENSMKDFIYCSEDKLEHLNALWESFPNLKDVTRLISGSVRLCSKHELPIKFPPLLVDGPPGIGKTQLFRSLSTLLDLPLVEINMSHLHGRFELVGGHRAWRDAEPGVLFKKLFDCPFANPILLFDEAELGDQSLYQPLYHIVEDDHFTDHFLELPFDVSATNIVFISNDKSLLPEALRSRLFEFDINAPNSDQMQNIVRRIYKDVVQSSPMFTGFEDDISEACVEMLCSEPMRIVRKIIYSALCKSSALGDKNRLDVSDLDQSNFTSKQQIGFI